MSPACGIETKKKMFDLKYFQYTSMMIMFMLAFFAVASRFFVQNRNRLYEQ